MTAPVSTERTPVSLTGSFAVVASGLRLRLRTPSRLRRIELGLLLIACAINSYAIMLVQFSVLGTIDWSLATFGIGLSLLVFGLHFAVRFVARDADPFVLPIATVLNGLGIAEIYRLDLAKHHVGWESAAIRQIVWTAIAVVLAIIVIAVVRNHRVLFKFRFIAALAGVILLLLPLAPIIGLTRFGARLWIHVGPLTFQPGELGKIALAIFFAGYLVTARESLSLVGRHFLGMTFPRARDLGPLLVVFAISMVVLVGERDLGTALLYFGLFLVMLYVATGRASWVLLGLGLFGGGALLASRVLTYVSGRFDAWLNPFDQKIYDANGGSYQLLQGIFGLSSGGLFGKGLGGGRPQIIPLAESDYIFASLGEELGLVGVFAILALYLLFVSRGFRIGFAGRDDFGRLLAVGLSFVIGIQVFIVIGGVTRVIPLTGLTTPFLAAGGSSLVANWIIVALLLRLSDTVRNQPKVVIE